MVCVQSPALPPVHVGALAQIRGRCVSRVHVCEVDVKLHRCSGVLRMEDLAHTWSLCPVKVTVSDGCSPRLEGREGFNVQFQPHCSHSTFIHLYSSYVTLVCRVCVCTKLFPEMSSKDAESLNTNGPTVVGCRGLTSGGHQHMAAWLPTKKVDGHPEGQVSEIK